jgi:hypothetical protein
VTQRYKIREKRGRETERKRQWMSWRETERQGKGKKREGDRETV